MRCPLRLFTRKHEAIGTYLYWSSRLVQEVLDANAIMPGGRLHWSVSTPGDVLGLPLPQLQIGPGAQPSYRHQVADRIERAAGLRGVTDFAKPRSGTLAKGVGRVNFARFIGPAKPFDCAMMHASLRVAGRQTDIIMFGSLYNLSGRVGATDPMPSGWTSSAMFAIADFLSTRGTIDPHSLCDDPQSLSYEAWKLAHSQGMNEESDEYPDRPWLRGYTFGHDSDAEWVALIYSDVIMDKKRWRLGPDVDRILVGAPLWIRTGSQETYTRYQDLRRLPRHLRRRDLD